MSFGLVDERKQEPEDPGDEQHCWLEPEIRLPNDLVRNEKISCRDMVLWGILRNLDSRESSWASNKYLAQVMNTSADTIKRSLSCLKENGLIVSRERDGVRYLKSIGFETVTNDVTNNNSTEGGANLHLGGRTPTYPPKGGWGVRGQGSQKNQKNKTKKNKPTKAQQAPKVFDRGLIEHTIQKFSEKESRQFEIFLKQFDQSVVDMAEGLEDNEEFRQALVAWFVYTRVRLEYYLDDDGADETAKITARWWEADFNGLPNLKEHYQSWIGEEVIDNPEPFLPPDGKAFMAWVKYWARQHHADAQYLLEMGR